MIEPFSIFSHKGACAALAALAAVSGLGLSCVPAAAASVVQPTERTTYVFFGRGRGSTTMSASTDDLRHAQTLRTGQEPLLYVRQAGVAYVIRDAATLRRAEAIFEPQRALGERQAELGTRQAALGRRQAALGSQQARLGARQAGASPAAANELGRQQAVLGAQQNDLGREQNDLGRQQSALGSQQSRLAREADVRLRDLVTDAIRSGVAQRVN